jgi:phospholipid transport system substrate-binding protein
MSRRIIIALLALLLLGSRAFYATGQAATGNTPSDFIRYLGEQAVAVLQQPGTTLEQRETRFRELLAAGFDMEFIGRFVMGNDWRKASPEQRADYLDLFNEYVLRTYSARFGGYAGERLNVVSERPAGQQDVLVATRIDRPSGPPINAEWRVRVIESQFRIIDVAVEGISMVMTQRSEFATVINKSGVDGLIEILRARNDKLGATAGR